MGGIGEAVKSVVSTTGDSVVTGAKSIGEFASGAWEQGTDLQKGIGDIIQYDAPGIKNVIQDTPDGLVNPTEFINSAGNVQYMGDIAPDINWSKTLGNLTGQAAKNYMLNRKNTNGIINPNFNKEKNDYWKLLSELTGSDLTS